MRQLATRAQVLWSTSGCAPTARISSTPAHPSLPLATCPGTCPNPQIKKNTSPHELKPSDILIERFTAWKQIVKMLICEPTLTIPTTDTSLLRGHRRHRGQHVQGAHQACRCYPGPIPPRKPVPRRGRCPGRLLHHPRQDPRHCRLARLARAHHRLVHRSAPPEAPHRDQGAHQERSERHWQARGFGCQGA